MPAAAYLTFGAVQQNVFASTATSSPLGANIVGAVSATESTLNWAVRQAGIWSNLQAYIIGNASSSVVLRFRVNAGNGNQLLSVGTTANTYFQDTSNTDTVVATDLVNLGYTAANTNNVGIGSHACVFTAQSGYMTKVGSVRVAGQSFTAAATDNLLAFGSIISTGLTDTTSKTVVETAGTARNLFMNVLTNARTTTTNGRLWKNNAAGNLIIPYTSGQTGQKEDTSNTDTFSAGDTLQNAISTAAADTNSIVVSSLFVSLTNTTSLIPYPSAQQSTQNANLTRYCQIGGRANNLTTVEAETQLKPCVGGIFQKSSIQIDTNTVTATSNFRVRVNGNPGNNVRAVGSGVTGVVTDTSNTDTVAASDLVNLQMITGATGTSLVMRNGCISFAATVTSPMYYYLNQLLTMGAAA